MKIVQIAGFLGSGKTTLLLRLSRALADGKGLKVALVVNEIGEIPVDGKVMEESGMKVKDIGGGCICCEVASTFARTLTQLYKDFAPDVVLVEPTGVAIPRQVSTAASMGSRSAKVEIGPVVVLFDATRADELLDMELMGRLVTSQLVDADIVAVSKIDIVAPEEVERAAAAAREVIPGAVFVPVSSATGEGFDTLIDHITAGFAGAVQGG
ncbi:MAG: GTP-binding protein [Thermoleophilia bacterium]